MKIFINNRNFYTWPKGMTEQFLEEGHEVIIIDNGSTYEPLLDWYNKGEVEVVRLPNLGKTALWSASLVPKNEYFVLTDPDYDLSMVPSDWPEVLMEGFHRFKGLIKAGLSWEEDKVPPENPAWILDDMCNHPEGLPMTWGCPLEGNWFNYPCDTSFAIYPPGSSFVIGGIRKGKPYTGRHLPWHITLDPTKDPNKLSILFDDEIEYYFDHVENSSCTAPRIGPMLAEYKRRKNENRK